MHRAAARPTPLGAKQAHSPGGAGNKSASGIYGKPHAPTDGASPHARARGPLSNSPSAGQQNAPQQHAGGGGEAASKPKHAAGFAGRQPPAAHGARGPPGRKAAAAAAAATPTEMDDEPFVPEMEEEGPSTQGDHLMFAKARRQASSSGRSFFGDDEVADAA